MTHIVNDHYKNKYYLDFFLVVIKVGAHLRAPMITDLIPIVFKWTDNVDFAVLQCSLRNIRDHHYFSS